MRRGVARVQQYCFFALRRIRGIQQNNYMPICRIQCSAATTAGRSVSPPWPDGFSRAAFSRASPVCVKLHRAQRPKHLGPKKLTACVNLMNTILPAMATQPTHSNLSIVGACLWHGVAGPTVYNETVQPPASLSECQLPPTNQFLFLFFFKVAERPLFSSSSHISSFLIYPLPLFFPFLNEGHDALHNYCHRSRRPRLLGIRPHGD